jgi:hypothetical protein
MPAHRAHIGNATGFGAPASLDEFAICSDRGHGVAERECGELLVVASEDRMQSLLTGDQFFD